MRTIKVKKSELLAKIKSNLNSHMKEYQEACSGYAQDVEKRLQELERLIVLKREALKNGEQATPPTLRAKGVDVSANLSLERPEHHEKDYRQVIEMLEMEVNDEVEVDSREFACYVQDDWDWKDDFQKMSSNYVGSRR